MSDVDRPQGAAKGLKWLFVDDDPDLLKLFRVGLTRMFGYTDTAWCLNSDQAIEAFSASPASFELIVTDLNITPMDGLELSARLWELAPDLEIILITGDIVAITEREAGALGFSSLLYKPFTLPALGNAISKAVSGSRCHDVGAETRSPRIRAG